MHLVVQNQCISKLTLQPQGKSDLRQALQQHRSKPYWQRLSDFHLLLWLLKQPNMDPGDMATIAEAIRNGSNIMEGYQVIIDSIAGL